MPPDAVSVDDMIAAANPVPWSDAEEGDVVGAFLGHVIGGRYAATGEFMLTVSIPREIMDPHALMESMGMLTYWEVRRA